MEKPKRIQRKRTKGWRMPENTVSVTRPGKWGNPFSVELDSDRGKRYVVNFHGEYYQGGWATKNEATKFAVDFYKDWILRAGMMGISESAPFVFEIKEELKGKNLACFCKEGETCHADVLLELANS